MPTAGDVLECRSLLTPAIASLELANDTGTSGDNVTSDTTIKGTVSASWQWPEVQLDVNGDGVTDETDWVDADAVFEFPHITEPAVGEHTYRVRGVTYDDMGQPVYSEWSEITFTYNPAAYIWEFVAIEEERGLWFFKGNVHHDNPASLVVTFGGVLEGQTVVVELDGSFVISARLEPGEGGLVSAQITDEYGETSNLAEDWVYNF